MIAEDFFNDNKLIPFHTDSFHYKEIYKIMQEYSDQHNKEIQLKFDELKKITDLLAADLIEQSEFLDGEIDSLNEYSKFIDSNKTHKI